MSDTEPIESRDGDTSEVWERAEPTLFSDFTARPFLLEWCEPVQGYDVLDLGCGEGYFARKLNERGAARLEAIDSSPEMIRRAVEQEARDRRGISYAVGDACDLARFPDASFDLVVAVLLFNHLSRDRTAQSMGEVRRVLRPGGRFVFATPHPSLPFLHPNRPPFFFDNGTSGYFSGRDRPFEGQLWRRDGTWSRVRCVHKTIADYFSCLAAAGFETLPEVAELHVSEESLRLEAEWFSPLADIPLHLAFRLFLGGAPSRRET